MESEERRRELLGVLDELAFMTRAYFLSLVEHGFEEEEALVIVALWTSGTNGEGGS